METSLILKMLRVKHQLTQEEVAKKLGISKNTYHRKEIGMNDFTISEAVAIGKLFNVNPGEIFFESKVTNCITKAIN